MLNKNYFNCYFSIIYRKKKKTLASRWNIHLAHVRSANMLFLFRFPVDSVTVSLVNRVARNQSFSSRWHCHDKTQFLLSVLSLKPSTHKTRWAIADLFITYPPSIKHGTANNQRHYLLLPLGHLFFLSFNSASRKAAL